MPPESSWRNARLQTNKTQRRAAGARLALRSVSITFAHRTPFGPSHLSTNCPELDQVALATVDALSRPACFLFIYLLIRSAQWHPFFLFFSFFFHSSPFFSSLGCINYLQWPNTLTSFLIPMAVFQLRNTLFPSTLFPTPLFFFAGPLSGRACWKKKERKKEQKRIETVDKHQNRLSNLRSFPFSFNLPRVLFTFLLFSYIIAYGALYTFVCSRMLNIPRYRVSLSLEVLSRVRVFTFLCLIIRTCFKAYHLRCCPLLYT